ncbi:AsmA family protein [Parashewanella spongiae]|uniref:AsmA family protein n=1 Tax=Parashewanella spongiae TaxID=342950 RepID=A0A3A6TNN8_9GAMM|nr:AsmA family protein [Parashewanella spongiae]MCL1078677.1 AsmA family protein [Parashewanella spongiae]RJY12950.1 AsmA family protein [Parashewanella spongiae]
MKIIKWLVGLCLFSIGLLVVYLTMLFDLNDFKPQIIEAVKKQTGRDLVISKDLSWTVFPNVGIEIEAVTLSNPSGFSIKNMVTIDKAVAEVAFMPLLSKEIEVIRLKLEGIDVNLVTRADGSSSLDGLSSKSNKSTKSDANESASESNNELNKLHINGIDISDTKLSIINEASNTKQVVQLNAFSVTEFDLGKEATLHFDFNADTGGIKVNSVGNSTIILAKDFNDLTLKQFKVETEVEGEPIPNKRIVHNLDSDIHVNLANKKVNLTLNNFKLADIVAKGEVYAEYGGRKPSVNVELEFNDIDLTPYMPKSVEDDTRSDNKIAVSKNADDSEPDLSVLSSVNAKINVTIKSIKAKNIETSNWVLNTSLTDGLLNLTKLSADLYEGSLLVTSSLDARKSLPQYAFSSELSNVKVRPLLTAAADLDVLAGTAEFHVKGSGQSLRPSKIKTAIKAKGNLRFSDGALYGVNIPLMVRNAKAKLTGGAGQEDTVRKTDFTSLSSDFNLVNGIFGLTNTKMISPLIRVSGQGNVNLVTEALNYRLETEIVASLEGQSSELKELSGVPIPLHIKGTITDPKVSLDTKALLNNKLDKEKDSLFKKFGF